MNDKIEQVRDRLCDKIDAIWTVIDILSIDEVAAAENAETIAMLKYISDGIGYAEFILREPQQETQDYDKMFADLGTYISLTNSNV